MNELLPASTSCLEDLPNVGRSIAADLRALGYQHPAQLVGFDPLAAYDRLAAVMGTRHDPCVLDVLMSVRAFLDGEPARPWWHYTAQRKQWLVELGRSPPARSRRTR